MSDLLNPGPARKTALWVAIWAGLLLSPPLSGQSKLAPTRQWHTATGLCVAINPDGNIIAFGSPNNTIRLCDVASGKEQASLKASGYGVYSVAFSPNGKALAAAMVGNNIKLWDVGTGKNTNLLEEAPPPKVQSILRFARPIVVFNLDGKILASGGRCLQNIRLWDVTTAQQTATLEGHDVFGVSALVFLPNGRALTSLGGDDTLKQWDLATGKNTVNWKIPDRVSCAAFSPDGKMLVTNTEVEESKDGEAVTKNTVKLWDVANGKVQTTLQLTDVSALTFSWDGKKLAFGSEDGKIKLWDVSKGRELAILCGHTDSIWSLAFSTGGNWLASGSKDKTVKLWDVAKLK